VTLKDSVDIRFHENFREWLDRMAVAQWSRLELGRALGDTAADPKNPDPELRKAQRGWFAKLQRWGDTRTVKGRAKWSAPKRSVVSGVLRTLRVRDADELIAWFYGEREKAPAWVYDERMNIFAEANQSPVAVADAQAATRSRIDSGAVAATGTDPAPVAGHTARAARLPSSVRAILADVRDGLVTPEEAERMLAAWFLERPHDPSSSLSPSKCSAPKSRSSGDGIMLPFPATPDTPAVNSD